MKYVEAADAGGKQKMVNTALKPGETELAGNCNEFTKMHTLFDIQYIQLKLNQGLCVCLLNALISLEVGG
jgi:hypothetical protein